MHPVRFVSRKQLRIAVLFIVLARKQLLAKIASRDCVLISVFSFAMHAVASVWPKVSINGTKINVSLNNTVYAKRDADVEAVYIDVLVRGWKTNIFYANRYTI